MDRPTSFAQLTSLLACCLIALLITLTTSPVSSLPVTPDNILSDGLDLAELSPSVTNLPVPALLSTNWTAVEDTISSLRCASGSQSPPYCQLDSPMVGMDTPLEQRSACLWSYVTEEDPLRIPRVIRHVRCSCKNCQMNIDEMLGTGCVEQHVTIPVVRCPGSSDVSASRQCYMYLQRVSVACVCAYKLQAP